jgi:hypothetical protein
MPHSYSYIKMVKPQLILIKEKNNIRLNKALKCLQHIKDFFSAVSFLKMILVN